MFRQPSALVADGCGWFLPMIFTCIGGGASRILFRDGDAVRSLHENALIPR